ncbi:MAG: hypothetical protein ABIA78_04590 [archaeon]
MRLMIALLMVLVGIGFVCAGIPSPNAFYGDVYYSDGTLIQDNLELTAKISGEEFSSILLNGGYDVVIESENSGTVYFYIAGLEGAIGTQQFDAFAVTELDFTTELVNPASAGSNPSTNPSKKGSSSGSSTIRLIPDVGDDVTPSSITGVVQTIDLEDDEQNSGVTGAVVGGIGTGQILVLAFGGLVLILGAVVIALGVRKR